MNKSLLILGIALVAIGCGARSLCTGLVPDPRHQCHRRAIRRQRIRCFRQRSDCRHPHRRARRRRLDRRPRRTAHWRHRPDHADLHRQNGCRPLEKPPQVEGLTAASVRLVTTVVEQINRDIDARLSAVKLVDLHPTPARRSAKAAS